ncbi:MAG: IclR family transcriptional regulator [Ilumatobacteraceae bacterium]
MPNTRPNLNADGNDELDDRYVVKSVVRAIKILEALEDARGDGLNVTEIARLVGVSKSTAFSTLYTLRAHGLVADKGDGATRRYRLGLALVRLGQQASVQTSVADLAQSALKRLTDETGLSSRVAVLDEGWAVVVGRVDTRNAVRLDLRMGRQEWPHCTGVGKALLSTLSDDQVREILDRIGMPARTKRTITDPGHLLTVLARARIDGFCIDDEEDAEGIMCISAPVLNLPGAMPCAVSVTGLKADPLLAQPRSVGRAVRAAAEQIADLAQGRPMP